MKRFKKLIAGILSATLFFSNGLIVANAETVSVSVVNNPKVDIMLTQKETSLDLSNFENDIKKTLENKGVDTNNIEVQTVERNYIESEDADFSKIVNNWESIEAPIWSAKNNTIFCNITGGQTIWNDGNIPDTSTVTSDITKNWKDMNTKNTSWWSAALFNPNTYDTSKLDVTFLLERNGNLRNGFAFNVTKNTDGTFNGYFFDVTNHMGYWPSSTSTVGKWIYNVGYNNGYGTYKLILWKFDHVDMDKSFTAGIWSVSNGGLWCWPYNNQQTPGSTITVGNEKITCMATWTMPRTPNVYSTYNVKYNNNQILITLDGNTVVNLNDSTYTSGTYGFWTNNCERSASMSINKFTVTTEKFKTFKEVLRQPTWRDDAEHIVVNVDDNIDDTLTGTDNIGEILSRTLADDIHFIQWGTNTNKSASQDFIARNDNKGVFYI